MRIEEAIRQDKFRSPHQKVVLNLLYTSNWLLNRQQEFFKHYSITTQQFNILRILRGSHPERISAKEIKKRMLDQNSDVSRLLGRLAMKKLIERKECPDDKRAADVFITKKGLTLLQKIDPLIDHEDRFLRIDNKEAMVLSDLLDKCRQ